MELVKQLSEFHLEDQMVTGNKEAMDTASHFMEDALGVFVAKGDLFLDTAESGMEGRIEDGAADESDKEIRRQSRGK